MVGLRVDLLQGMASHRQQGHYAVAVTSVLLVTAPLGLRLKRDFPILRETENNAPCPRNQRPS